MNELLEGAAKDVIDVAFERGTIDKFDELFTRSGVDPLEAVSVVRNTLKVMADRGASETPPVLVQTLMIAYGGCMLLIGMRYKEKQQAESNGSGPGGQLDPSS